MKGVIFCLLEKMVVTHGGADAWDRLVRQTPLKTVGGGFLGPATYPDEDLFALVGTASAMTGQPVGELMRAFARFIFPDLMRVSPLFAPIGMTAKRFLMSVDRVIHVEVRKLHPEANLPYFDYEDPASDRLVMLYRSPRNLCDMVPGLIEGASEYFGEGIEQVHAKCVRDGHPHCRFELRFTPGAA